MGNFDSIYRSQWMDFREFAAEDQRDDGHQFDQDVEGWAGGVLQRIAHCIAHHCRFVDFASLADHVAKVIMHGAALNVLLCVVPGTSGVSGGNSQLNSADDGSRQESGEDDGAESESEQQGGEDDLNNSKGTKHPGAIISLNDERVEILMQAR
jgi:hypothetical protein